MIPFARTHDAAGSRRCGVDRSTQAWSHGPRITVVIPTFRRPELLCRCLEAVFAQTLDPSAYEIVVVDDGHSADTQAVVDRYRLRPEGPVLRFLRPHLGRGPAVARNAGWRAAYGKVIAFTDDDAVPESDWLANGERALAPGWVALAGRVAMPSAVDGVDLPNRPAAREPKTWALESTDLAVSNAFVRRSALLTVGGFDERFQQAWGDASDLHLRLLRDAGPIGHSDDAVVLCPARPEHWNLCLEQQKNAYFDALLYKKHPRVSRERLLAAPPWNHYAIVALTLAAPCLWMADIDGSAVVSLLLAFGGVLRLALKRLRQSAPTAAGVAETVLTSALIPFLSVYWRLRGAIRFRVLFL